MFSWKSRLEEARKRREEAALERSVATDRYRTSARILTEGIRRLKEVHERLCRASLYPGRPGHHNED